MIVPQPRLVLAAALVLVPFGSLLGAVQPVGQIAALVIAAFAFVVLIDWLGARRVASGIRVFLPELVRLQREQEGSFDLVIERDGTAAVEIRIGLPLPATLGPKKTDELVSLSGASQRFTFPWSCKPRERGSYTLESVVVERRSAFGFWARRHTAAVRCEFRVYPSLHDERRNVAALFLRRSQAGLHTQNLSGQGREFEKLRAYQPGDSLSDIHWKSSAKRRSLVSKVFQVEQTHEVYVLVDASRLSARDLRGRRKEESATSEDAAIENPEPHNEKPTATVLEKYVTAALILGRAAEQQGDRFGLMTFSDRVLSFVRAKTGQAHYDAVRERLYSLQPQIVSPDFEEMFSFVRLRLRKRALLIVLTNLDDPVLAESFVKASDLVSRQHLVIVNMLQRPGVAPVFQDPTAVKEAGDLYHVLAGHKSWHRLRELEKVLKRRGVRFSTCDEANLVASLIKQHAEVRRRQLV